jgi:hypothetical protein
VVLCGLVVWYYIVWYLWGVHIQWTRKTVSCLTHLSSPPLLPMFTGYFTSALYARIGNSGPYRLLQNMFEDLSLAFTFSPFDGPPTDTSQTQMEKTQTDTQTEKTQMDTQMDTQTDTQMDTQTDTQQTETPGNKYDTAKEAMKLPANARQRSLSAAVQERGRERGRERAASRNCRTSLGLTASPVVPVVPAVAGKKWTLGGTAGTFHRLIY